VTLTPFQRAAIQDAAEGFARKHAPKPSSWWTQHAAPESTRAAFVAEVNRRALEREQKHGASSAGIALHPQGPA
jgi:hypothetical protein